MARILVCEPNSEVRALLAPGAPRRGHAPGFGGTGAGDPRPDDADVLLVEPADRRALAAAQALRQRDDELPIVCTSIYPATRGAHGLRPVAYLVKPFPLGELERVLVEAVGRVSAPA